MDDTPFELSWERLDEALLTVVVLAFLLERALAIVFEHRLFVQRCQGKGYKEFVAFALAGLVCWHWDFDAISLILAPQTTTRLGILVTAAVIAGGSKGAVRLFRDLLGIKSVAYQEAEEARAAGEDGAGGP